MAYSVFPTRQKPISCPWKKWMKASDPAPYKGCIIFLLTLFQLCCSGLEHCKRKMGDGNAHVWWLVRRGEVWVVEVSVRSSAMMVMSSWIQLLVLLCGNVHLCLSHDDDALSGSKSSALLMLSPLSGDQFCSHTLWTRQTHFSPFSGYVVVLVPYLTLVATCLWKHVQQYFRADHSSLCHIELCIHDKKKHSLLIKLRKSFYLQCCAPLLWNYLASSSLPASWKCGKKVVAMAVTWGQDRLCSLRGRTALRLGVMAVLNFVNEMLLMMAGDVEPNPGPGNFSTNDLRAVREAIFSIKYKWFDIGVELGMSPYTLKAIKTEHPSDTAGCLTEMLIKWLSGTSPPPTWSSLIKALSSEPVGEKRLAEEVREKYCYQDEEQATGQAPERDQLASATETPRTRQPLQEPANLPHPQDTSSVSEACMTDTPTTDVVQLNHSTSFGTISSSSVSRAQLLNLLKDEEFETEELFKIQIDEETGEPVLEDSELHHDAK